MYIAHAPISYLANEVIQKREIKKLKLNEQILVAVFSMLFGILPDFDLFLNIPGFIHHSIITHTPIFYIAIWLLLKLLINPFHRILAKKTTFVLDRNLLNILANTFLVATLFHLLADLLSGSIILFYPISSSKIYLFKYLFEPNLHAGYFFSFFFAIEILAISIFIYYVYDNFLKNSKIITTVLKGLICLSVTYLPVSAYISFNTYNRMYMYDKNGEIHYDLDYDTFIDRMDMDVGNTGEDNIQKAKEIEILDSTLDVINSQKWTSKGNNQLSSKLKYTLGGFDSYRIIAQTYYNINLPIEPVLRDSAIKRDGFISYSHQYDYQTLLFEYLQEEDELIELNLDATVNIPSSKIFFLIDSHGEVLNLGITLEGNYLATVLDTDYNLSMHSYQSIRETYDDEISKIYIQK
jgi:hypothetical protein